MEVQFPPLGTNLNQDFQRLAEDERVVSAWGWARSGTNTVQPVGYLFCATCQSWTAYSTARTALRQQKAAAALLAAATESYNAALQSYSFGVRSQIDVVSAQRALAVARTADVNARTQLLTGVAALAFQTGDLLHAKGP